MLKAVKPSSLVLPIGHWQTIYAFLIEHFSSVSANTWEQRFLDGKVLNDRKQALSITEPFKIGQRIYYFREIEHEPHIPFYENILFENEEILIADKPHFLPVVPSGDFVKETLLSRLIARTGNYELQPVHRIDRHTAGIVMFSKNKAMRHRYQSLFQTKEINKTYEAIAPTLLSIEFPHRRESRIVQGDKFFLSKEVVGDINAVTDIEVLLLKEDLCKYRISPITGKKHQIRLHMAALGAPLLNDCFYPVVDDVLGADFNRPLQLLAKELSFIDPLTGQVMEFQSKFELLL